MTALRLLILVGSFVLCRGVLFAQQYAYINDNIFGQNAARALQIGKGGVLIPINGWATGGSGFPGIDDITGHTIVIAQPIGNTCLFASNGLNRTVAAFTINVSDGSIAPVSGSPFSVGGFLTANYGLAVGRNTMLLSAQGGLSVLRINGDCTLSLLNVYPQFSGQDLKVTPNGNYLITAAPVDSFQIDYDTGQLTEIGPMSWPGNPMGVDISCDSSIAYIGHANGGTTEVEVFNISSAGELTQISDFTTGTLASSGSVLLSPGEK